jgi:hypothetical protein
MSYLVGIPRAVVVIVIVLVAITAMVVKFCCISDSCRYVLRGAILVKIFWTPEAAVCFWMDID